MQNMFQSHLDGFDKRCVHMQVAGSALHLDEQRLWWDDLLCPERDGDSETMESTP